MQGLSARLYFHVKRIMFNVQLTADGAACVIGIVIGCLLGIWILDMLFSRKK